MKELYFYPTLNENSIKDFGIEVEDFSFNFNGQPLAFDELDILRHPADKTWLAQNNGMTMTTKISLKTPEKLYGKNGVICTGAKIGFYAIWSNPSTMQSGSKALESADGINYILNLCFEPNRVKGRLDVTINAYVETPAVNVSEEDSILMNETGVSIGVVASRSILLNDERLSFPIINVQEEDRPLWWVDLKWSDPIVDRFDNSVTVFLNRRFKTCPSSGKELEFMNTIIAAVYFLIIKKIGADDDEMIRKVFEGSNEFEEFSVCSVMSHFCRMLNFLSLDKLKSLNDEELLAELQKEINLSCGGAL